MNLGAQNLRVAAGNATIEDIATELGFERTYCGRVLAGTRPASLAFRRKARERYGVGIDDWDRPVADDDEPTTSTSTGTES